MRRIILISLITCFVFPAWAQQGDFPFREFRYIELQNNTYDKDTSAQAVVLNEFGDAHIISNDDINLVFDYHVKIKILKTGGLDEANITVYLRKQDNRYEVLRSVEASTFTIVNGTVKETPFDGKSIFTQNRHKYLDVKKFTLPNVQVGSIMDIKYTVESPFIYNFKPWYFQSDLPKVHSEFWATIPANYHYNITLRGFLKLTSNESEVINDCFKPNGHSADCAKYKFVMKDIPAFIEEEYMTASSNYIAAINFELSEIKYFDGRLDKITKEWKDADMELRQDAQFGVQLRRGEDILDNQIEAVLSGETDSLRRARKIYFFIRDWYQWNDDFGKYSEFGIRKAFANKRGNVGDINLSLLAALKYAGLSVEPLLLSTRDNGTPIDIHPVLSDFNYVIAKLRIGKKNYLLDATDDVMPFGMIPTRCLNGKGRALGEEGSYWFEINPADKMKHITVVNLKLDQDGFFRGTIATTYMGYEAFERRKKIKSFGSEKDYFLSLNMQFTVNKYEFVYVREDDKPLIEKFDVEIEGFTNLKGKSFFFNPFIVERWDKNPFKSSERLYPVDFGIPIEEVMILEIEVPEKIEIVDLPAKVGLALPNKGGRYIYEVQQRGNKILVNHSLVLSKAVFSSQEYHYLKELFSSVVQMQNADLIFKEK